MIQAFQLEAESKAGETIPANPPSFNTVVKQANLWTQGKAQIQTIVNTCTGIVAQEADEPVERQVTASKETVERAVSPLHVTPAVPDIPVVKASASVATSTEDHSSENPLERHQDDTLKTQKADLLARLSQALNSKHLLFTASGVTQTLAPASSLASGLHENKGQPMSSTAADAAAASAVSQSPARLAAFADPRRRAPVASTSSVNKASRSAQDAGKVSSKAKIKSAPISYKTTMDEFLDMDIDFEGLPVPESTIEARTAAEQSVSIDSIGASAAGRSKEAPRVPTNVLPGADAPESSSAAAARLHDLRGRIEQLSGKANTALITAGPATSAAPTASGQSKAASATILAAPLEASTTSYTADEDGSPAIAVPGSAKTAAAAFVSEADRPAPTVDPRRRGPLPAAALKSMFVSRPTPASSIAKTTAAAAAPRTGSPDLPKAYSTRPVAVAKGEVRSIDRERAAAIAYEAKRESERLREEERAAEERERGTQAPASEFASGPAAGEGEEEDEDGDSTMHDLFSGEDDDDDGDEDEDVPPIPLKPQVANSSQAVQTANPAVPSVLSTSAADAARGGLQDRLQTADHPRTREQELRHRLKRARDEPAAMASNTLASGLDGRSKRRIIAQDDDEDDNNSEPHVLPATATHLSSQQSSQSSSFAGSSSGKVRMVPVVEVLRRSVVARKTTGGGARRKPTAPTAASSSSTGEVTTSGPASPGRGLKLKLKISSQPDTTMPSAPALSSDDSMQATEAIADGFGGLSPASRQQPRDVDMQPAEVAADRSLKTRPMEPEQTSAIGPSTGRASDAFDASVPVFMAPVGVKAAASEAAAAAPERNPTPTILPVPSSSSQPTSRPPSSQDRTAKGKPKAAIPAGSTLIEITDSSDGDASGPDSDVKMSVNRGGASSHSQVRSKAKPVLPPESSDDELPDLPFFKSRSQDATAAAEHRKSRPGRARKGSGPRGPLPTVPEANGSVLNSRSPLPGEAPKVRRAVQLEAQQQADPSNFARLAVGSSNQKSAANPAVGAGAASTMAGSLPNFRRNEKQQPHLPPPAVTREVMSPEQSQSKKAAGRPGLPERPSAETIAAGGQDKLPTLRNLPRSVQGLTARPDEETRRRAFLPAVAATHSRPPSSSRRIGRGTPSPVTSPPPLASSRVRPSPGAAVRAATPPPPAQDQEEEVYDSPPFQAESPPASFDWLHVRSREPESSIAAPAKQPNGYVTAVAAADVDVRIASSQTPEPHQLTDTDENELEAFVAQSQEGERTTAINGYVGNIEMEVDELEDADADGEADDTIGPTLGDIGKGSPVPSSPPSTAGRTIERSVVTAASVEGTAQAQVDEVDRAAEELLQDISQSLLDEINKTPDAAQIASTAAPAGRSESRDDGDSEADEVQGARTNSHRPFGSMFAERLTKAADSTATTTDAENKPAAAASNGEKNGDTENCIVS